MTFLLDISNRHIGHELLLSKNILNFKEILEINDNIMITRNESVFVLSGRVTRLEIMRENIFGNLKRHNCRNYQRTSVSTTSREISMRRFGKRNGEASAVHEWATFGWSPFVSRNLVLKSISDKALHLPRHFWLVKHSRNCPTRNRWTTTSTEIDFWTRVEKKLSPVRHCSLLKSETRVDSRNKKPIVASTEMASVSKIVLKT